MLITQQCRVAQNLQFIKTHNNVKQNKEVCLYLIPKPHTGLLIMEAGYGALESGAFSSSVKIKFYVHIQGNWQS